MKDKFKKILANDMNIKKFSDESECEYNQRLIYSAGAAWAKTLVFGNSYTDNKINKCYVNSDIMYVETHLSKVLEAFLKSLVVNEDWLYKDGIQKTDEGARILASQIIRDVIYTYNLAEISSRRLIPVEKQYHKYDEGLYLVRGESRFTKETYCVGVAQWIRGENTICSVLGKNMVDVKGKDYYKKMDMEFPWREADLPSEYLIFVKGSKGYYSKCWRTVDLSDLPQGINILRLASAYSGGYVLVKRKDDRVWMIELDPWYTDEKEVYRILYALNYENNTPAEFEGIKKVGYYILKYSGAIPNYENRIVMCCSWPYQTFDDRYSKIIPEFLWNIVERNITDLGIKIVYINSEDANGRNRYKKNSR